MLSNAEQEHLRRLRWKCRRGALELDLILNSFLENHYSQLSLQQKSVFERFLEEDDPVLQQWLMGQASPEDKAFSAMIEYINQKKIFGQQY